MSEKSDFEWNEIYMRVICDPRFKLFGLTRQDILDLRYYLDCWNKTPRELKKEVPK